MEKSNIILFDKPKEEPLVCAFCLRPEDKVPRLIGEQGYPCICSDCIKKCNQLLKE